MFPITSFEALLFTFSGPGRAAAMVRVARFITFLQAFFIMSTAMAHTTMLSLRYHYARGVRLRRLLHISRLHAGHCGGIRVVRRNRLAGVRQRRQDQKQ